jgi:hypothetical protein
LIFFGYFLVSRQKSNWGKGQRPWLIKQTFLKVTEDVTDSRDKQVLKTKRQTSDIKTDELARRLKEVRITILRDLEKSFYFCLITT